MPSEKADVEGQAPKAANVDAALEFLNHETLTSSLTEIDEKKLVRKIDWCIIPLMCSSHPLATSSFFAAADSRLQGHATTSNTSTKL